MSEGPLKTLYENIQTQGDGAPPAKKSKTMGSAAAPPAFPDFAKDGGDGKHNKPANKRLSVERIYQKKTQLEHILLRPDTYIGSIETVTQQMWVMDEDTNKMETREITYVPGLYKIFDEIMVNAADNKVRDPAMDTMKIDIDAENSKIRIWNNGKGIPVVEHKTEKMYVPTMIFGHLLTSSNYDDSEKKVTGGRNGFGAKLCNIFSTKFVVETSSNEYKRAFKQTWTDNMSKTKEPIITQAKDKDFTCVTFFPDLAKFGMTNLDKDIVALFTRRAYDVAASNQGVRVFLNGKKLPVKNFRDYMDLYLKDKVDEAGQPVKVVHEKVNPRWEVAITLSDRGFQQVSFVNSIATTKGGRHVDYVADQCVSKLIEIIKKKNKDGIKIMPFQVRNHLWVFINCLVENPTFDSQTKEHMTKQAKSFGSKCQLSENFVKQVNKCGIVESVLSWMKFKAQTQLNKKCLSSKHSKLKGIPKLDDANDAGTKHSDKCTLILTEGDSAKTLAVAGLGVIGRDKYGVFPLRGKVLNVREATHKQIMDNAEINNVIKIMGLHFKEKYETAEQLRTLRYGKLMIMTDQDQDGSHIKGLLLNFIHHFWPNLLRHNIVEEFITPIVKVTKGKTEESFFSLPEFEEWKSNTDNWHTWKIKYYKGLGTSTSKEAKEYFSDMPRHRIPFRYGGGEDDASINLAFSKKKVEDRKEWLSNYMEERKRRTEMGLPELYLYTKDTRHITYSEFINRELILFSNADNVRSIPSLMDGLKPGQRKVLFTCIKRNLTQKELKVAQLAGSVAEQSAYHHGETSLMSTIINLAQNFVGSNNLNLLQPIGQFGTRLHGGKDAASPRYIFTMLSPLARHIINAKDDALLRHLFDDNQRIEPEWYCPILPMVLINGADGIGTGWSTKVPNYDIREIVANLRRLLEGQEPLPMVPAFKNFRGTIEELGENRFICSGEISVLDNSTVEITELPVRTWTQTYKEEVLEAMLQGTDKTPPMITDYKEYNTDTTVKFVVKMTPEKLAQAEQTGLHKVFKLQSNLSTNMVLFDNNGCIKKYNRVEEILREFFEVRQDFYQRRKIYLEGMLTAESLKLDNIARFILEKIEGTIVIENKPKREIIQTLVRRGYDSDPVKAWKEAQKKDKDYIEEEGEEENANAGAVEDKGAPDFNYILNLPLWSLTKERKDELIKQGESKREELQELRKKSPNDLWTDDLDQFLITLDEVEQQEREDMKVEGKPAKLGKVGKLKSKKALEETKPSPVGRRIQPRIDSATKMKAEKADAKKSKGPKGGKGRLLFEEGISENTNDGAASVKEEDMDTAEPEPLSLAQRLKLTSDVKGKMPKPSSLTAEAAAKEKKPCKPAAATGRRRPKGGAGGSPAKGKKGKKHNPWSDSEDDVDLSDLSDDESGPIVAQSRGPRRAAATKAKFTYNDSDDDFIEDDSDAEFNPKSSKPSSNKAEAAPATLDESGDEEDSPVRAAPKRKFAGFSDDEDGDDVPVQTAKVTTKKEQVIVSDSDESFSLETEKPAPSKAKAATKKAQARVSDSDESFSLEERPAPAKATATTKKAQARVSDSDESFSLEEKPAPSKAKAATKKAQARVSDSDESFSLEEKPAPSKAKATTKKAQARVFDSDESFSFEEKPAPAKAKAKPAKKTTAKTAAKPAAKVDLAGDAASVAHDGASKAKDGSSDIPVSKPAAKKAASKPPAPKKAKKDPKQPSIADAFSVKASAAPKSKKIKPMVFNWDDESEPEIQETGTFANPQAKKDDGESKPKKAKGKPAHNSDSDAEEEFVPKKKKVPAKKKTAKKDSDDSDMDMDDIDAAPVARRAPTGRAKAAVKYTFDDSMDDFDDDF